MRSSTLLAVAALGLAARRAAAAPTPHVAAAATPRVAAAVPARVGPPPSAAPGATLTALKGAEPAGPASLRIRHRGARPAAPLRFGMSVDAGVPDGANVSLVMRPWRPLRVHAGGGYNGISQGLRAGFTLVPRDAWFSPSMSVDIGRYEEGDANDLARRVSGDPTFSDPMLEKVGYRYTNAHLGFELGRKHATFYVHAGYSWLSGSLRNTGADSVGTIVSVASDPDVSVWSVSARVGLVVYVN